MTSSFFPCYVVLNSATVDSLALHSADDFGSQAFHLLGLVEEQVKLDEFGSCLGDLAQAAHAG